MPTEMRQIAFQQQEVARALLEYDRRRDNKFPPGNIRTIEIEEDPEIRAIVTIEGIKGDKTAIGITAETLAAALILFCINHKIPIPVDSTKRLQKVGDGVALFVVKRHKSPGKPR